jgi:predicted RNase H-like nuclease
MKTQRHISADLFGIDGCKAGWFVARQHAHTGEITTCVIDRFDALLDWEREHAIVAVDIPIGLSVSGTRACDIHARTLLKRPRASSVFAPPTRAALAASTYEEACAINLAESGKRISIQAYHIGKKIREVDTLLLGHPAARSRLFEVHPELSFMHLAMHHGGPAHGLRESKAHAAGFALRHALLVKCFGSGVDAALAARRPAQASQDDVLDAFAVLWSARRIASGEALRFPETPDADAAGIPMAIYC